MTVLHIEKSPHMLDSLQLDRLFTDWCSSSAVIPTHIVFFFMSSANQNYVSIFCKNLSTRRLANLSSDTMDNMNNGRGPEQMIVTIDNPTRIIVTIILHRILPRDVFLLCLFCLRLILIYIRFLFYTGKHSMKLSIFQPMPFEVQRMYRLCSLYCVTFWTVIVRGVPGHHN